jgi:hypothetical protein
MIRRHTFLYITGPSGLMRLVFQKVSEGSVIVSLLRFPATQSKSYSGNITERFRVNNRSAHKESCNVILGMLSGISGPGRSCRSFCWKLRLRVKLRSVFQTAIWGSNETRAELTVPRIYISFANYVTIATLLTDTLTNLITIVG